MKNKKTKKSDNKEFKPLSDELGIEPPKIYRNEQRQRINSDYYNDNKKDKKKNKTKDEKPSRKRKLKSKYRNIIYGFVIAIFIVVVLVVLSLTVLFKIDSIEVIGNERYTSEEIVNNTPIELQSNLFLADVNGAEDKLEMNLPYLYEVNIERKIPSKLIVNVKEADKFYTALNNDSTYILMDDNFKVLETNLESQPVNAVLIDSVAIEIVNVGQTLGVTDENIKASISSVNDMVKQLKIAEITSIYATDNQHNYAVYDNRLVINLGNTDNLEHKLYLALASIDKIENTDPNVEGDLDVSGGKECYFTKKK